MPDLTVRRPIRPGLVDSLLVLVIASVFIATISTLSGVVVLAAGAVAALLPRKATFTASGIRIGRRELPWADISAIDDVKGLRSRYVRVFVKSTGKWRKIPALRMSRTWPGRWYGRALEQVAAFTAEHVPQVRMGDERKYPAWLYPVVAGFLVVIPIPNQDPVRYWLPVPVAVRAPGSCDVDPPSQTRYSLEWPGTEVESPILSGTGCLRQGPEGEIFTQVKVFGRVGPLNGAGAAHQTIRRLDLPARGGLDDDLVTVTLPYADEALRGGYVTESGQGALVIERRANVIVVVLYATRGTSIPRDGNLRTTREAGGLVDAGEFAKILLNRVVLPS